jgi:hypothetical protein
LSRSRRLNPGFTGVRMSASRVVFVQTITIMSTHVGHFFAQRADQIQDELERIERGLRDPETDQRYCQLYAAQQALAWAMNPGGYASPFATIQRRLVRPLRGTQEDLAGYPVGSCQPPSLGSHAQLGTAQ